MSESKPTLSFKLDDTNYAAWSFAMQIVFEDAGCNAPSGAETVPNENPFRILNTPRAKLLIIQNVSPPLYAQLQHFQDACEMWNYLYRTYSGTNHVRMMEGVKLLATVKFTKPTMAANLENLLNMVTNTKIATGSDTISIERLAVFMFLNCLPARYSNVRSNLEQSPDTITMASMTEALKADDARQSSRDGNPFVGLTTTPAAGSKRCPHGRRKDFCWTCDPSKHPSKQTCKDCGVLGHYSSGSAKCAKNPRVVNVSVGDQWVDQLRPTFSKKKFNNVANAVTTLAPNDLRLALNVRKQRTSLADDEDFILDSGCSTSIVKNKAQLKNYLPCNITMNAANNGVLKCIGYGDLTLNKYLTIPNVLHCRQIPFNLISTSQICDLGFTMSLDKRVLSIKHNRTLILQAFRTHGLYMYSLPTKRKVMLTTSVERTKLFHRRLGHPNYRSLKLLSHASDGMVLDKTPDALCEVCQLSKAHRQPFPPSISLASHIGDLIHADLCHVGISTILEGFTMFMALTDDSTRYTSLYLLKHKDDAVQCIIEYDRFILNKTGHHLKVLRSDNGGEFINHYLKDYFDQHGVRQQTSTPYTPQQNGRAERFNRTLLEGVSAMLIDSKLPWNYWGFAALTFTYLKNRSPHSAV